MPRTATGLRPISDVWEWQVVGRCRDRPGEQFFHPEDDLGRISRRLREAAAKRVCQGCPVRPQCATHALSVGEEYGVWGGFSEADRAVLRDVGWRDTVGTARVVDVSTLQRRLDRRRPQVPVGHQRPG